MANDQFAMKAEGVEHRHWMGVALDLARKALDAGEFPVGAVLVSGGRLVGEGGRISSRPGAGDVNELDHAEILALRDWISRGRPRSGAVVCYSTLEPCLMCTGALLINGVDTICFAYEDVMGGGCGLDFDGRFTVGPPEGDGGSEWLEQHLSGNLFQGKGKEVVPWIGRQESLALLAEFFKNVSASHQDGYLRGTLLERYTLKEFENSQSAVE